MKTSINATLMLETDSAPVDWEKTLKTISIKQVVEDLKKGKYVITDVTTNDLMNDPMVYIHIRLNGSYQGF